MTNLRIPKGSEVVERPITYELQVNGFPQFRTKSPQTIIRRRNALLDGLGWNTKERVEIVQIQKVEVYRKIPAKEVEVLADRPSCVKS